MTFSDRYRERANAENLARQAKPVQLRVKLILEELEHMRAQVYWAIDGEDDASDWASSFIERAHALVDLGHEYRQALAANPPPQVEEEVEQ